MKRYIICFLICINILSVKAAELSDSIKLSVLTVTPGNELYSTFGHTAIRLTDHKNDHDIVFNYGTFDFRTPNFYLKFALGMLDYQLAIESFEDFMAGCAYENRGVTEQELNLTKVQTEKMVKFLLINYQPENRKYRYKFFTDNCSTRPRDVISQTLGSAEYLENTKIESDKTFRELFTFYLTDMPWNRFGTELLLGKMTDRKAGYDAMFLPDNLKSAIDKAQVNGFPLEKAESVVLEQAAQKKDISWFSPMIMAFLLILLSIGVEFKKTWVKGFDRIFFVLFGILGIFITVLSFASHHEELKWNFVILFFIPLIFLIPFFKEIRRKNIAAICFAVIILSFISIPFLPQSFNTAVLLTSVAVAIRCFFNFAKISREGIRFLN